MNTTDESAHETGARFVQDLMDVLDAKFQAGEGVIVISPSATDTELVSVMRAALSHGVPFKVVPGEKLTHLIKDEGYVPLLPSTFLRNSRTQKCMNRPMNTYDMTPYTPYTKWDHPKPPGGSRVPPTIPIPISYEDFVTSWGARIHSAGRFFTAEEAKAMDYHHVWAITDVEAAHVGLAAVPGEFMDRNYGYCVTDRAWDWSFYQAGGYAVVTDDDSRAQERFDEQAIIPLPCSTQPAA